MSVIIRLQNLPWNASALDIRQFFYGLSIPDGGVHIIGGEKGDAFIAFSTDEDARRAMMNDGGKINDFQIRLFLSSKTEMQNVIVAARGASQPPMGTVPKEPFGHPAGQEPLGGGHGFDGYEFGAGQRNRNVPPSLAMGGDKREGWPQGVGPNNPDRPSLFRRSQGHGLDTTRRTLSCCSKLNLLVLQTERQLFDLHFDCF